MFYNQRSLNTLDLSKVQWLKVWALESTRVNSNLSKCAVWGRTSRLTSLNLGFFREPQLNENAILAIGSGPLIFRKRHSIRYCFSLALDHVKLVEQTKTHLICKSFLWKTGHRAMVSDHLAHWEQQPKREETNGSEGLRERRHDASAHCRAGRRAAADFSAELMKSRKKKKKGGKWKKITPNL